MRQAGIPKDILRKLRRRNRTAKMDLNILWCALGDAIEFLESLIYAETPIGPQWRKEYPALAKDIDRYYASLKYYKRVHRQVIKEGNERNWR